MKKIIYTPHAPAPIGPYSQGVLVGQTLYVSGQIALDPLSGALKQADVETETRQVMRNLMAIVEAAGLGTEDIVKCSIFLTDMNLFAEVNAIYGEWFGTHAPARETVEVAALPKGAKVEVSCVAVLGSPNA
ncbi:MAG: RidA family protein [Cytophagales bacterium]|nr:RidA family protein [Cytophagales bacterium]